MERADVAVVGAGILGLATALELSKRFPGMGIVVVDKESRVATHQSGRNSGVIHSGLYYRPGSLKAKLCVAGAEAMVAFCREQSIPYLREGKVVVAVREAEVPALDELERRGHANGLRGLRRVTSEELREIEPHASAVAALHVPSTGTVDFGRVAERMAELLAASGAEIRTGFELLSAEVGSESIRLLAADGDLQARAVINCAGLYADRVAALLGVDSPAQIVPFRGEYFDIAGESAGLVRGSIYPVPDPRFPFLGVHLTRTVWGSVHAGPNAVLGLAREGYRWRDVEAGELWETLSYRGFRRLARRYWKTGAAEMLRSFSKRRFVRSARRLVPDLDPADVSRGQSGVRAQAVNPDGALVDDFLLVDAERSFHVLNAPSPAATSSLEIADYLADRASESLGLRA